MINALLSLNADLASSIAFRYACRLMEQTEMRLQSIHVEEVGKESYPPGSGWVRHTWEKGLVQTAREEIAQLMNAEKASCPPLGAPTVRVGEYDEELLHELTEKSYDLLIEGVLNSFHSQPFYKKIRSKLYKYTPCPILMVKNLVNPGRAALLLSDEPDVRPLVSVFMKLFDARGGDIDLIYFSFKKPGQSVYMEKIPEDGPSGEHGTARTIFDTAKSLLAEKDRHPKETWVIRNTAENISEFLSDYGLIGACFPRSVHKDSAMLNLLGRIPSAVLLCKK